MNRFRLGSCSACRSAPLVLVASALLLPGCSRERVSSLADLVDTGAAAGFNVLLVSIDTARADRFGCYGYELAETPCLDRLAHEGVLFADAVASAPLTLPSHATLLTGLSPLAHGVHDNGTHALGPGPRTLAEVLREEGYATAAFVGAFVLDARFGLDRGFDVYDFAVAREGYRPQMPDFNERPANDVTDAALAWLEQRREAVPARPFFAWVHYFDPHLPYTSPLVQQVRFRLRPYDAEVAFVDRQLQRLVSWLEQRGLADRTLVVVTADHGESLGEHAESTHGMFIYESTLRVPLVVWSPALFGGPRRVEERLAGLVDVRPTIEDLLGVATDDVQDGLSLARTIPAERAVYIETEGPLRMAGCSPLRGLRTRSLKYIHAPEPELYDLVADPREARNLHDERPAAVARLQAQLDEHQAAGDRRDAVARTLSEEEVTRLRSLGYAFSAGGGDTLPDPKWRIEAFNAGMEAEQLYSRGEYAQAAAVARSVLDGCPSCMNAARVLAFSEIRQGRNDLAIALLRDFVHRTPDPFMVQSLAQALIIDRQFAPALAVLADYAELAPDDGRVPLLRGDVLAGMGDLPGALQEYERAAELDENRVGIRAREAAARTRQALDGNVGEVR